MKKRLIGLGLLLIVIASIFLLNSLKKEEYDFKITADSKKFKKEYEEGNGLKYKNGKEYLELNIPEANPFVYLDYNEMIEFIKTESGILLFSRPGCPYCRSTMLATIDFAKKNNIDKIYYYNPEKIREENGTEYKSLLELLDSHLPVDKVTQKEEDPNFDINLKRIVVPQILFVHGGEVVFAHQEGRTEFSDKLSDNQIKEIISIYESGYFEYKNASSSCLPVKQEEC